MKVTYPKSPMPSSVEKEQVRVGSDSGAGTREGGDETTSALVSIVCLCGRYKQTNKQTKATYPFVVVVVMVVVWFGAVQQLNGFAGIYTESH